MQSYVEPDIAFIGFTAFVEQEVLALALSPLASRRIMHMQRGPLRGLLVLNRLNWGYIKTCDIAHLRKKKKS
jgi:hypothetical protein